MPGYVRTAEHRRLAAETLKRLRDTHELPSGRHTKFAVGDKVRLNKNRILRSDRHPLWLRDVRMDTPRTVIAIYNPGGTGKHARYYLGSNQLGDERLASYRFECSELIPYTKGKIGRPKTKRRYRTRKNRTAPADVSSTVDLQKHQAFCA